VQRSKGGERGGGSSFLSSKLNMGGRKQLAGLRLIALDLDRKRRGGGGGQRIRHLLSMIGEKGGKEEGAN